MTDSESSACTPYPVQEAGFNAAAQIPFGCTPEHMHLAMNEFVEFLGFINNQLHARAIARLETVLMPANFSSLVGEFMGSTIPQYARGLVKNQFHNGHPDLLPAGLFPDNAAQYANVGIEIKASRQSRFDL